MIIRTLCQCEKCGAEYESATEAELCENAHLKHEWAEEEYLPNSSIPYRVKLGFSNDEEGIYELVGARRVQSDV